jgi:DNA-directed RNA polymerase specialized sigma24 family protein
VTGNTEEVLSLYFPLHSKVHSYSCPAFDSWAKGGAVAGPPSSDLVWVIDVGKAFTKLGEEMQMVLYCLHGARISYRNTARRLHMSLGKVQRREMEGKAVMSRLLRRRGVGIPLRLWLKYG